MSFVIQCFVSYNCKMCLILQTCQSDLVRDGSHKYFIAMIGDTSLPFEHRTMAVFVLSNIVRNFRAGQQAVLQANAISVCLEALGLLLKLYLH